MRPKIWNNIFFWGKDLVLYYTILLIGMMRERSEPEDSSEPSGDPEMVPEYVKTLLPVFCRTLQSSLITSVKRAALGIIMKMVHYVDKVDYITLTIDL